MTDVLVVCSPGGHFSEARDLMKDIGDVNYKYVLHLPPEKFPEFEKQVIVAPHAERDLRIVWQFIFALICVWRERPAVVLSTGALIAITFGLAGKIFGAKFIFVESETRVLTPSLSAKLCYKFADVTYVRHKALLKFLPSSLYIA